MLGGIHGPKLNSIQSPSINGIQNPFAQGPTDRKQGGLQGLQPYYQIQESQGGHNSSNLLLGKTNFKPNPVTLLNSIDGLA